MSKNREHILSNAYDLVIKNGIKQTSMDDIATSCTMSKKTIYQYFENKSSLIQLLVERKMKFDNSQITEIQELAHSAVEEIHAVARFMLGFLKGMHPVVVCDLKKYYPDIWSYVYDTRIVYMQRVLHNNILRGQKEGYYHSNYNGEIISESCIRTLMFFVSEPDCDTRKVSIAEIFENVLRHHIMGLLTEEGRKLFDNDEI